MELLLSHDKLTSDVIHVSLYNVQKTVGVFWALHFAPWNVVIQLSSDVPLGGISLFFMWWRNTALINISHISEVILPLWLHTVLPKWSPGCAQEMLLQDFLWSLVEGWVPAPGWKQGGGCTGISAAPWWLLVVTYRGAANCSNEGGQLGGSQTLCRKQGKPSFWVSLRLVLC